MEMDLREAVEMVKEVVEPEFEVCFDCKSQLTESYSIGVRTLKGVKAFFHSIRSLKTNRALDFILIFKYKDGKWDIVSYDRDYEFIITETYNIAGVKVNITPANREDFEFDLKMKEIIKLVKATELVADYFKSFNYTIFVSKTTKGLVFSIGYGILLLRKY
jgi:hypothetical protein